MCCSINRGKPDVYFDVRRNQLGGDLKGKRALPGCSGPYLHIRKGRTVRNSANPLVAVRCDRV